MPLVSEVASVGAGHAAYGGAMGLLAGRRKRSNRFDVTVAGILTGISPSIPIPSASVPISSANYGECPILARLRRAALSAMSPRSKDNGPNSDIEFRPKMTQLKHQRLVFAAARDAVLAGRLC